MRESKSRLFTPVNLRGRRKNHGPFIERPTMEKNLPLWGGFLRNLFLTNKKSPQSDLASVFIKNQ